MKLINSFLIAFSMYSKIPMPKADWEKENMKYVMCFFPWVGAVIGALFTLWGSLGSLLPISHTLYIILLLLIPVTVTGGIHLDGLMDTADAISSWQPRERRLEILKDPHTGAFGVMACVVYFFIYYGFLTELSVKQIPLVSFGFFLSRALSGYAIASFPCAKDSGLAATFSQGADKKRAKLLLLIQIIACGALMILKSPLAGTTAVSAALLCFLAYYHMAKKKFGGITGDLAGWFLQLCELCILAGVVAVQTAEKFL
ncbi:MAG: adenosylcobinamide-GDP ribazoletransferase [Lachnospiraceae bacterium]|jgi:adenosylcobinamide-GDP ribazoletransferase|nr:adenosylcobinamide-GDP ribazoletransferase [Lachnospiraceae bacterium]